MKILLIVIIIAGIAGLLFFLLRNNATSESLANSEKLVLESFITLEQIPSVFAKLRREGKNESFAVFMFEPPTGQPQGVPVNLQYSIENGVIGLDWVLLSPRNIADKELLSDFITKSGYKVTEQKANDVSYLRVEGNGIAELGVKICREFYKLSPNEKIELLVEGIE